MTYDKWPHPCSQQWTIFNVQSNERINYVPFSPIKNKEEKHSRKEWWTKIAENIIPFLFQWIYIVCKKRKRKKGKTSENVRGLNDEII